MRPRYRTHGRVVLELQAVGLPVFFDYVGVPDARDVARHQGEIGQPTLALGPAATEEHLPVVKQAIEQALSNAGITSPPNAVEKAAVLELRLAAAALPWEQNEFPSAQTQHPMTWSEVAESAPGLPWMELRDLAAAPKGRPVNVKSPTYLKVMAQQFRTAPLPALRAYLQWKVLRTLGADLPPRLRGGVEPDNADGQAEQRERYCQLATLRGLGLELSRQFAKRMVGPDRKETAQAVAERVRDALVEGISEASWLSAPARANTRQKIEATNLKIGFPEQWPPSGTFELSATGHLDNVIATRRYERERSWARASQPRDRIAWDFKVRPNGAFGMVAARLTIPNGFPDQFTNSIVVVAATLLPPLFDGSAPLEVQYARHGFTVAHELIHAAENAEYDALGRARRLWSDADLAAWKEEQTCLVEQGNTFTVAGLGTVDGAETVEENVADLGGLRYAFAALEAELGPAPLPAGPDGLTPRQRFFYAYAQMWCAKATKEEALGRLRNDWHGPPSFRVNGPLSNMPAFAEALACQPGDPMVRPSSQQCTVW